MSRFYVMDATVSEQTVNLLKAYGSKAIKPGTYDIAYGSDRACGYFLSIFSDEEEPIVDLDRFSNFTGSKLGAILNSLPITQRSEMHVFAAFNDMPL